MRIAEGVEWGAHCCLLLDWLGPDATVTGARLAAAFELPAPYLTKQLQALVAAGLLRSTRGPNGGFALARPLERITMLDVVEAIEGTDPAFRCTEIRQCGIGRGTPDPARAFRSPCNIAGAMHAAEEEWRRSLRASTLADLQGQAERASPGLRERLRRNFAALET